MPNHQRLTRDIWLILLCLVVACMARLETDKVLVDTWEASSTIRRRFKGDKAWLLLPPSKDPEQDEMERPMSTRSLAFNSSAVAALIRRFAPRKLKVRMLLGPIKSLYHVMGAQADRRQTYVDAWVLRRLYTYARRRQQDAAKRNQTPREPCLHLEFEYAYIYIYI